MLFLQPQVWANTGRAYASFNSNSSGRGKKRMILTQTKDVNYMDNTRMFLPTQAHYLRNLDPFAVWYLRAIFPKTESRILQASYGSALLLRCWSFRSGLWKSMTSRRQSHSYLILIIYLCIIISIIFYNCCDPWFDWVTSWG